MRIIKLGGSLFHTPELKQWLTLLSRASEYETVIIVPGGGPFADEVRHAQRLHCFSDATAHHMAILAMSQFGLLIKDLAPNCRPFYYPGEQQTTLLKNGLYIWLPDHRVLSVPELKHNWNITSDSMALWLSQSLKADELSIIKRSTVISSQIKSLINHNVLDSGFLPLFHQQPVMTRLFHFQQQALFPDKGLVLQ